MIHDIFITDLSYKILYGNPRAFPVDIDGKAVAKLEENYPVQNLGDKKLSNLKVNDVILSVYYSNTDTFSISKFLLDLKNGLENKISALNTKSVKSNYFIILKYLSDTDLTSVVSPKNFPILGTDNVYIDVIQKVHTLIGTDGRVIKNEVHGEIIHSDSNFKMVVESEKGHFKGDFENIQGKIEISTSTTNPITFYQANFDCVLFRMTRVGDIYTFESDWKGKFGSIEFIIPVGKSAYSAETKHNSGISEFDLKNGLVRWKFTNVIFAKEAIKILPRLLQPEKIQDSILINFNIEDIASKDVKIKSCHSFDNANKKYWVKYILQSGHYEIRQ